MAKRILSSVIGLPLLIFVVLMGGRFLQISLLAITLIGLSEFYSAVSKKVLPVHILSYIFAIIYCFTMPSFASNSNNFIILIAAFTTLTLLMLVIFYQKINVLDCAMSFIGFFYVVVLMNFIYLSRTMPSSAAFVWLIFISAWGSDTFAYFCGITLGKHKLCPELSPKKTVEGAIGGVMGAAILGAIYGVISSGYFASSALIVALAYAGISAVGAVASQFGDLAASAIKRHYDVKDYGHIIPGHGGILDRFDSILFTAPAIYALAIAFIGRLNFL